MNTHTRFSGGAFLILVAFASLGCGSSPGDALTPPEPVATIEVACTPSQPAPYADGIPYLGVHGDAGNSDIIRCQTASEFTPVWHALEGLGLTQPNTFSPDGVVSYATTTHPEKDGCRLHAIDTATGDVTWCKSFAPSIGRSSVEIDADGRLYFTVDASVVSLDADGNERWTTSFASEAGGADAPWGLHFTPQGHIATVTSSGTVYLLAREDGKTLDALNIAQAYGFVTPAAGPSFDVIPLFPEQVQANITAVWGNYENAEDGPAFANFLGAGDFVDNTLAVASNGDIYVIGGGPEQTKGALVKLAMSGTDEAPKLAPSWYAITHKGSATSPSISPGDQYVMISDGAARENQTKPGSVDARVKVFDISHCDANTDADPDEAICGLAYEEKLERGAVPGSPAIDADGVVYFYEFGLDWQWPETDRDIVAFDENGVKWSQSLEGDRDWTSVVTVSENHIIGTATRVQPSEQKLGGVVFPQTSDDALVVLDRKTGLEIFSAPVPDDSAATVTVGPDGALYVGMYGLISVLSVGETPTLGLLRFSPTKR
jgi:outer membrane protein assembly factor BamB